MLRGKKKVPDLPLHEIELQEREQDQVLVLCRALQVEMRKLPTGFFRILRVKMRFEVALLHVEI